MGSGPKHAIKTIGLTKESSHEALDLCSAIRKHSETWFNIHDLVVFLCLAADKLEKAVKANKGNHRANIQKVGKSWQVRIWNGTTTQYIGSWDKRYKAVAAAAKALSNMKRGLDVVAKKKRRSRGVT